MEDGLMMLAPLRARGVEEYWHRRSTGEVESLA